MNNEKSQSTIIQWVNKYILMRNVFKSEYFDLAYYFYALAIVSFAFIIGWSPSIYIPYQFKNIKTVVGTVEIYQTYKQSRSSNDYYFNPVILVNSKIIGLRSIYPCGEFTAQEASLLKDKKVKIWYLGNTIYQIKLLDGNVSQNSPINRCILTHFEQRNQQAPIRYAITSIILLSTLFWLGYRLNQNCKIGVDVSKRFTFDTSVFFIFNLLTFFVVFFSYCYSFSNL